MITENARAHTLYRDLGFQDVRELLTWRLAADADPLPIPQELLSEAPPASMLVHFDDWHKEPPELAARAGHAPQVARPGPCVTVSIWTAPRQPTRSSPSV